LIAEHAPVDSAANPTLDNCFVLTAQIQALNALRYTPAGLPALDLELLHISEVNEAGQARHINMVVKAIALGSLAESLVRQAVGSAWQFKGFMAAFKSKPLPSKQLVFHIQSYQPSFKPSSMISAEHVV